MALEYRNVVFAYGMEYIFSAAGVRYLRDHGPNGFHFAFPGGAADPTPDLSGGLVSDGGDYLYYDGDLARFYAAAPVVAGGGGDGLLCSLVSRCYGFSEGNEDATCLAAAAESLVGGW